MSEVIERDESSSLLRPTAAIDQPKSATRNRYRGSTEVEIRDAAEAWGRTRWPEARVCHELVMDRGTVRLDVAFVSPDRLTVFELKSGFDTMARAIHQVALARLASHDVWLICDRRHDKDLRMVHYLLPSIGIAEASGDIHGWHINVLSEPTAEFAPLPEAMASLLWVAEICAALGMSAGRAPTHAQLVKRLCAIPDPDRTRLICSALRGRDAMWRADPPVRP